MENRFDILAEAYDAMIDWPRRLVNESPLLRQVVEQVQARRALDAACGTGRHAELLASWGLEVEAADLSEQMVAYARASRSPDGIRWVVRPFTQPAEQQFDLVLCTGNSLALAADEQEVGRALAAMAGGVRPGGALVIHVVNLFSRRLGPVVWDKCLRLRLAGAEHLVLKGMHRTETSGFVDFALVPLADSKPRMVCESTRFLMLRAEQLMAGCSQAGLGRTQLYGSYRMEPYIADVSSDLILVARRQAG